MDLPVIRRTGPDGAVRLSPVGEIDVGNAESLRAAIGDALSEPRATEIVVDLDQVVFLSCAGVSALVHGRRAAVADAKSYAVVNARGVAHNVLQLTGLLGRLAHQAPDRSSPPAGSASGRPQLSQSRTGQHARDNSSGWPLGPVLHGRPTQAVKA